jgi:hypothetical protein
MMGAGEILEGPVGSRGSCKKFWVFKLFYYCFINLKKKRNSK